MRIAVLSGLLLLLGATMAHASIDGTYVDYDHDGVALQGYLAFDDAVTGPRPGVLVVHQWLGLGDFEVEACRRLAELGYTAFAADVYGAGIRPASAAEAGVQAGLYRSDRGLMRRRVAAGLNKLKSFEQVDPGRTAAIGYCFGGGCVLELARSGAAVNGVVSFHGNLDTPDPADAAAITGSVLVLHGADDPHVPAAQVADFQAEMRNAGVDWQFVAYGGAVHAFTDYRLGTDPAAGAAYNAVVAKRSWTAMADFLAELFD